MDTVSVRNLIQSRYDRKPSTWHKIGIPHEHLDNIDLDLVVNQFPSSLKAKNYHVPPLGTFHSKFAIIDRQIALVNTNNINIRSNVEMMCQFEGDVVNSLYDTFLISWEKELPNPPGLPCLQSPASPHRDFYFGDRHAYFRKYSGRTDNERMDNSNSNGHAPDPAHELRRESIRYGEENHPNTAIPINERLNVKEKAEQTVDKHDTDFTPFYFHSPHGPVPMAIVNRQPQAIPGHHDLHTPQNAAWLQGIPILQVAYKRG